MRLASILLASVATMLPISGPVAAPLAAANAPGGRFVPPPMPLVLSRTVIRELIDGKQIVATRRYSVRFIPEGVGFRLDGELIGVSVDAPPFLARLAELERNRPDRGLFPIRLDAQGIIAGDGGMQRVDDATRAKVGNQANALIAGTSAPESVKREEAGHVAGMLASHQPSVWPSDLFVARPGERHAHRVIALPGGSEGEIDVVLKVEGSQACGLPQQVERVVTTVTGGSRQVSREVWTIECAVG